MENKKKLNWIGILMGSIGGATLIAGGVVLALRLSAKNQQFTIDFNINSTEAKFEGSTHVQLNSQITFGEINKPNITQAPTGKVFAYWSWNQEGTQVVNDSDKIESNCNVFAQWKDKDIDVVLSFAKPTAEAETITLVGPVEVNTTDKIKFGDINKPRAIKSKTGWTCYFDYWTTNEAEPAKGKIDDAQLFSANTTIYPVFKDEEIVNYHDITFQACKADIASGATVTFNSQTKLTISTSEKSQFKNINKPSVSKTIKIGEQTLTYSFKKWVKLNGESEVDVTDDETFSQDATISPIFEDEPTVFETNFYVKDTTAAGKGIGSIINSSESSGDNIDILWQNGDTDHIAKSSFNMPVYVGSKVTNIEPNFLSYCPSFNQTIVIPSTVKYIGNGFLAGSTNFNNGGETLNIPGTVESIGSDFLKGCDAFNEPVTMNSGTLSIGQYFLANTKIFNSVITFPDTLTTIGDYFLAQNEAFNLSLTLPASLTSLGSYFCYYCTGFTTSSTSIVIDLSNCSQLTEIQSAFLYEATYFSGTVKLPSSITKIGYNFMSWIKNGTFNIDMSVLTNLTYIDGNCFNACNSFSCNIDLSKSTKLTYIGQWFLRTCKAFNSSIKLPESGTLQYIGEDFMYSCSSFNQPITIPYMYTAGYYSIGKNFMFYCKDLTSTITLKTKLKCMNPSFDSAVQDNSYTFVRVSSGGSTKYSINYIANPGQLSSDIAEYFPQATATEVQ